MQVELGLFFVCFFGRLKKLCVCFPDGQTGFIFSHHFGTGDYPFGLEGGRAKTSLGLLQHSLQAG